MQTISVYGRNDFLTERNNQIFCNVFHERNGQYLEREFDPEKFLILKDVDDCSPTELWQKDGLINFLHDLEIVITEAKENCDDEMSNHLKEVFVLAKFCLWNLDKFGLYLSPWGGTLSLDDYPQDIPEKYRYNIAKL